MDQGDPETIRRRLDELYREKILQLRERFLSSLQNAPEVAENLKTFGVITENERIAIVSKPHRQQQKEAIFYTIARKSFVEIDNIIEALKMELTGNENLQASLKILKIRLCIECPFNREIVQIKPVKLNIPSNYDEEGEESRSVPRNPRTRSILPNDDVNMRNSEADDGISIPLRPNSFTVKDSADSSPSPPPVPKPGPVPPQPIEIPDTDVKTFRQEVIRAAAEGDVTSLKFLLESCRFQPDFEEKMTKRTPLHYAVSGNNSKAALECVELLIERQTKLLVESESDYSNSDTSSTSSISSSSSDSQSDHESTKFINVNSRDIQENTVDVQKKLSDFINHQDERGLTVLHVAAENECVEIVKLLYEKYQCDAFIKSKDGLTALDLMYIKTPEAIVHILNGALPTTTNYLSDGKLKLEIDFRSVIGLGQKQDGDENEDYTETEMLAKLVHQNKNAGKLILHHVIVKTFLDFKWGKMKMWLYSSIAGHILLHLWYTCFVVQVFLISCPYSVHKRKSRNVTNDSQDSNLTFNLNATSEDDGPRNIFSYLIGDWNSGQKVLSTVASVFKNEQLCELPSEINYQAIAFLIIGGFFFFKEIYEAILVKKLFLNGTKTSEGKWTKFWSGALAYLKSVENIFQLIFIFLMVLVSTLAFQTNITDFYYSVASFSIVVAWSLILMQIGNISGLGAYVQILGKVIKSFFTMMATYMVLIIAFSISFSIMFHKEKPFETLPKSFARVIIMMVGELNYDETFYDDNDGEGESNGGFASHLIYLSFVVMVTIILINLLIGLTVSDVQTLRGKSEVILRAIQVEQLYIMENSLLRLSWLLLPLKNVWRTTATASGRKAKTKGKVHLDIFVIDPNQVHKGMVLNISIKDVPRNLQKEIRTLAGSKEEYMKEYMNKYSL